MPAEPESETPSELIDAKIEELGDWRGEKLSRIRGLTKQAAPEIVEEIKWRKPSNPLGDPVWSHEGIILTGEIYKDKVKLTFAKGASLEDPSRPLQLQPRGQGEARHRPPRGRRH